MNRAFRVTASAWPRPTPVRGCPSEVEHDGLDRQPALDVGLALVGCFWPSRVRRTRQSPPHRSSLPRVDLCWPEQYSPRAPSSAPASRARSARNATSTPPPATWVCICPVASLASLPIIPQTVTLGTPRSTGASQSIAGEDPHLDESHLGELGINCGCEPLGPSPGREHDVRQAIGGRHVDRLEDRRPPTGRAHRPDDARRPQDRETADDSDPGVERLLGQGFPPVSRP